MKQRPWLVLAAALVLGLPCFGQGMGRILVDCDQSGVTVSFNGAPAGSAVSAYVVALPYGTWDLRASKPGFPDFTARVIVSQADARVSLRFGAPLSAAPQPAPAAPAAPGGPALLGAPATIAGPPVTAADGTVSFWQGAPAGPAENKLAAGEVLAAWFAQDRFDTAYAIATVKTPASPATKGEYELLSLGEQMPHWTFNVITRSRPASKEELRKDMLVLFWNRDGRKAFDRWGLGVVSGLDELYKNNVELTRYNWDAATAKVKVQVDAVRIIVEPVLRFRKVGSNWAFATEYQY